MSAIAYRLQHRGRMAPSSFGTELNPLEPALLAELEAYFAPFQAQLQKILATHRKCFAERTAALKGQKKLRGVGAALAKVGRL